MSFIWTSFNLLYYFFLLLFFSFAKLHCLDGGSVFTCGDGSFGQLGHGDFKSHCSAVKVSYFDNKHVERIACGMRHSIVLLKGNCRTNSVYVKLLLIL